MISVRTDKELEDQIDRVARIQGVSRSAVVKLALQSYLEKYERPSAWDIGKDLFGRYGSGKKHG